MTSAPPLFLPLGRADSRLGFSRVGGGSWAEWDRFLSVDGRPAYHLGNICNTCEFFFERLDGATSSVEPTDLADALQVGLGALESGLAERIGSILPVGEYAVTLQTLVPRLVRPFGPGDYFSEEQVALWGTDAFWDLPHDPRVSYYRGRELDLGRGARLFEFVVPMFPRSRLHEDTVATYRSRAEGRPPTALALSVLDVKQPADWDGDPDVTEHWCLAHYLLDGHHKTAAAADLARPGGILSYLAMGQGISTADDVTRALAALGKAVGG